MEAHALKCHVCGRGIPLSDLEAHRALTLLRRRTCRRCRAALESALPQPPATAPSLLLLLYLLGRSGGRTKTRALRRPDQRSRVGRNRLSSRASRGTPERCGLGSVRSSR